jgi:hypothetical protein
MKRPAGEQVWGGTTLGVRAAAVLAMAARLGLQHGITAEGLLAGDAAHTVPLLSKVVPPLAQEWELDGKPIPFFFIYLKSNIPPFKGLNTNKINRTDFFFTFLPRGGLFFIF